MKISTYELAMERVQALQTEAAADRMARRTRKAASPNGVWSLIKRLVFGSPERRVAAGA